MSLLKAEEFVTKTMKQTLHTLENIDDTPLALTIGNFDGVHIGHQAMMDCLVKNAEKHGLRPAAMTFSPHAKALFSSCENHLISSDEEKARVLFEHGIEQLYQIPFNQDFANLSPETFLDKLRQLPVKHLLVGEDFRFGHKGKGNWDYLLEYGKKHNIIVEQMPTIKFHGERVSSSRIRKHIFNAKTQQDFEHIGELLGRPLAYEGTVISGKKLGRTINFPTANIHLPQTRLLPAGVFVVTVQIETNTDDRNCSLPLFGMCNIGTNPTVDGNIPRRMEVHLFDFDNNLYDKKIRIQPLEKLRDEKRFNGVEELVAQLQQDKKNSLSVIGEIQKTR